MSSEIETLLTVDEVAAMLGLHRMTVYEKVATGTIPHIRIGRAVRFDRMDLKRWIDEQKKAAPVEAEKVPA